MMDKLENTPGGDVLGSIVADFGHVYYSLLLEAGYDPETKAIKSRIIGNVNSMISIPKGSDDYFNHRLCESLDPREKERLQDALNNAFTTLSEYEIELRAVNKENKSVWILNKGIFKRDPGTRRIIQYGFITTIPFKMLKRYEFGSGDDRYHCVAGLMNDYVFSVRCQNGEVVETIHGGACKDVTGYTEQDFLDDENLWFSMVHPHDKDLILQRANKMARGEQVDELIHRIKHKNGQTRWVKSVIVPHHDEFGNVFLYDGVIRDITDQVHEQQHVEQESYMNELLLDATPYPMILMQNDGIVLKANRAGYELGAQNEQSCSTMWKKEIDATCEFRKMLEKSMDSGSIVVGDVTYMGNTYEVTIVPNEPDLLLACLHDVTANRAMSDKLEEDKMIMQSIFENTIVSIMLLDLNGKFETINNTASKVIDRSQVEVLGLSVYEVFPREEARLRMEYIQQVAQTRSPLKIEESINGYELVTVVIPVIDKNSDVTKIAMFSKDVTQMKKAEANLIETYQVLTAIIENAQLVIIGLDIERRVILWNDRAARLLGIASEKAYNRTIGELYDSADTAMFEAIDKAYEGIPSEVTRTSVKLLNGKEITVHVTIVPKMDALGQVNGVIGMALVAE